MKRQLLPFIISICSLTSAFVTKSYAQAGSLDASFSGDGKVITAISDSDDFAAAVAVQADGKIVAAGFVHVASPLDDDFAAVRYNSDGSIDNTFGSGGKVTTNFGAGSFDRCTAMAIQSDGKIVLAGYSQTGGNRNIALLRYNTNGTLDSTFDIDGKVITDIANDETCNAVAIDANGKIIVGGSVTSGTSTHSDFLIVRYNSDGSLDNTFDTDGIAFTDFSGGYDFCYAVAVQPDGKIVAAGNRDGGGPLDFALARYNTDGTIDSTFGTAGRVTTDFGSAYDECHAVAIQSDGKIVAAGYTDLFFSGNNYDFAVARYNSNGTLDNSFDSDGMMMTIVGIYSDLANAVLIQSDGKIVVSGISANSTDADFSMVRLNANGSLDNSFGTNGTVITDFAGGSYDYAYASALQSDGKIILAGGSGITRHDFAVARYNGSTVGIDELNASGAFTVFPNPATADVTLNLPSSFANPELKIYNALGEVVFQKKINSEIAEIKTDGLSKGLYLLTVASEKGIETQRLIKK
jgi:uncharacterized delta-60 repeat protein